MTSPDGAKMVAIGVCYDGPLGEGERLIAPVRQFGPPWPDQIRPMVYTELQSMIDAVVPPRHQYYEKAHFLRAISDEAIDILVDHFDCVPSPLSLPFFQQTGGAMQWGVHLRATGGALYNLTPIAQWLDPEESERHVRWTREPWQALRPYTTGGVYVNDMGRE